MNARILGTSLVFGLLCCLNAGAQPLLPRLADKNQTREANDKVEGTIWEYRGKLPKSTGKTEDAPTLEGKFRLEGAAIFDISPTVKIPSKDGLKKALGKATSGKGGEVKLPAPPQQKRLGEYRKISDGKYRLDFSGDPALNGIMIIWKKKDTKDVWMGSFDERDGTKTVRKWDVELRPIED